MLIEMMNTLQNWTETGKKGTNGAALNFYISGIDIGNTFALFKSPVSADCFIKLYSINCLSTTDKIFCQEKENWLRNLAKRSALISGTAEKERHKFFDSKRQKISLLLEKIR